ncbi:MAG TPA: ABC transporter permease [Acetobacteraceae bacterium]|nr:ABC transporter permease [Acetobacteraceae bacterium]
MSAYVARRLLGVVLVVLATSVLIFAIVHILPGNVAYAILGEYATPAAVATLQERLGLNDPLWLQYWHWLSGILHGQMGQSLVMDRPAGPLILDALGRSAILAGSAFVIVASGGIALGVHAATHQGHVSDRVMTLAQFVFIAVPDFFWAILAVVVFASWLNWLPATGYAPSADGLLAWASHLVLPVIVLSIGLLAHVSRLTRAAMLEVLRSRYVLMARAKGMSERRVLWRHAVPNAMLPTITILAIDFGLLIGGVVVVETVFAYPGLGRLLVFAIEHRDLPLLQAGMLVLTTIYALANLAADLGYAALNPRIRYRTAA